MATLTATTKITKTTLKSFIKANQGKLFVRFDGEFSGNHDGINFVKNDFNPASIDPKDLVNSLKNTGIILSEYENVFIPFENEEFVGIRIDNHLSNGVVAIKK